MGSHRFLLLRRSLLFSFAHFCQIGKSRQIFTLDVRRDSQAKEQNVDPQEIQENRAEKLRSSDSGLYLDARK